MAALGVLACTAVFGFWTEAHGASRSVPRHPQRYRAFYRVRTSQKIVALTIDDGPDATITPQILAVLRRYGVHATFFDVGKRMLASPELVRDELTGGNEIGNHTFDHAVLPRLSPDAWVADIKLGDEAFRSLGLSAPRWFRPPTGAATEMMLGELRGLHHREVMWSLSLDRFLGHASIDDAVGDVLARIQPGDIILAHDCCKPYDRTQTVRALSELLPALKAQGYSVVTVSDLVSRGRV